MYSPLFKNDFVLINKEPAFFKDLKLDIITKALFSAKEDQYLIPYFYTKLNDKASVIYRQDVFKEFYNLEFYQEFKIYIQHILSMATIYNEAILDSESWYTRTRLAKLMDDYDETLNDFKDFLKASNVKSEALIKLLAYIEAYLNNDEYLSFLNEYKAIKPEFERIKFSLVINGSDIYVSEVSGDPDFSKAIKKISSAFTYMEDRKIPEDVSFPQTPHIDSSIYEKLAKIFEREFKEFDKFFKKYDKFFNLEFETIAKEFRFYFVYNTFIEKIKNDELLFSIPEISDEFVEDSDSSYDLALAYKYFRENKRVITNSYVINSGEKAIIISGPNQGGKTTFTRQFGQLHYLLALGVPVQGKYNKLHLADNLYSFFKTEENLDNLDGKLKIELEAVKRILSKATNNSIILFNEIFASTTKDDGLEIANLVLDDINKLGSFCVFVTFLSELRERKDVVLMCSNVEKDNQQIRTFKITRTVNFDSAYPSSIQAKYGLTYEKIKRRISNEG